MVQTRPNSFRVQSVPQPYVVKQTDMVHANYIYGLAVAYLLFVVVAIYSGWFDGYIKTKKTTKTVIENQRAAPYKTNMHFSPDPGSAVVKSEKPPVDLTEITYDGSPTAQGLEYNSMKRELKGVASIPPGTGYSQRQVVGMAIGDDKDFAPRMDQFKVHSVGQESQALGLGQTSMFNTNVPSFLTMG